jgi:hypothetical protein
MQRLEDGGGIYCLGLQPQTKLINNMIHDIGRDSIPSSLNTSEHSHCRGIYLDQGCAGFLVQNNIIYNTQDAGIRMQIGTSCNIILNNIIAFTKQYAIDIDIARTNVLINNIIYMNQGRLFKFGNWPNYEKFILKNMYWRTDGEPIKFAGLSWEEWRNKQQSSFIYYKGETMDEGSMIADPHFTDAQNFDFRLKPTSPALNLGFQLIDINEMGLTGDEVWRSLPSRIRDIIPLGEEKKITIE